MAVKLQQGFFRMMEPYVLHDFDNLTVGPITVDQIGHAFLLGSAATEPLSGLDEAVFQVRP